MAFNSGPGGSPPGAQQYQQYQSGAGASPPGAQPYQYASSPYTSQQQPQMNSAGPVGSNGEVPQWMQPNSAIPTGTVLATVGAGPTQAVPPCARPGSEWHLSCHFSFGARRRRFPSVAITNRSSQQR